MYKLTSTCKQIDIDGNIIDAEQTVIFSSKESLIEYLSGDHDGDNYGSGLIRILEQDAKLYPQIGKICNSIVRTIERQNEKHIVTSVCSQIVDYMMLPSFENARKLYLTLRETPIEFLRDCYSGLIGVDIDGDRPYEEEWCDNFVGMVRSNPVVFAAVAAYASNRLIDAVKKSAQPTNK